MYNLGHGLQHRENCIRGFPRINTILQILIFAKKSFAYLSGVRTTMTVIFFPAHKPWRQILSPQTGINLFDTIFGINLLTQFYRKCHVFVDILAQDVCLCIHNEMQNFPWLQKRKSIKTNSYFHYKSFWKSVKAPILTSKSAKIFK